MAGPQIRAAHPGDALVEDAAVEVAPPPTTFTTSSQLETPSAEKRIPTLPSGLRSMVRISFRRRELKCDLAQPTTVPVAQWSCNRDATRSVAISRTRRTSS